MAVMKSQKKSSSLISVLITLLLIAIVVLAGLTVKKSFEASAITPEEDTIKRLTAFVNKYPEDLDARVKLAYAYQEQSKWDEARDIYLDVIKVDSTNQAAMYHLGVIAIDNKDYPEAEKRFKELLAKHPSHLLGMAALSELYVTQKKPDLAIKTIDTALGYRPDIVDFRIIKAKAYELKGQKDKARAEYQAALKYAPGEPRATEGLAKLK